MNEIFDKANGDSADGTESVRRDQRRQIGNVELDKSRHNRNRKFHKHKHSRQRRHNCRYGDHSEIFDFCVHKQHPFVKNVSQSCQRTKNTPYKTCTGLKYQEYESSLIRTVPSASESHRINFRSRACGLISHYRRWGIAPRPEDNC